MLSFIHGRYIQFMEAFILDFHLSQFSYCILMKPVQVLNILDKLNMLIHFIKCFFNVALSQKLDIMSFVFHLMLVFPIHHFSLIIKLAKYVSHACFDVLQSLENCEFAPGFKKAWGFNCLSISALTRADVFEMKWGKMLSLTFTSCLKLPIYTWLHI